MTVPRRRSAAGRCLAVAIAAAAIVLGGSTGVTDAGVPFELGALKLNTQKGTAKLEVTVPARGKVEIVAPKTVAHTEILFDGAGSGSLPIRARQGKPVRQLRARGRLKVTLDVFYAPGGSDQPPGGPSDLFRTVTLRLKR